MRMPVPTNATAFAVCTPMMRSPTVTTIACSTPSVPNSRKRPTYASRTRIGATPSVSTSTLKITIMTNAPIHSDRFVNSAAIAEPYESTGNTACSATSTGVAMNCAICCGSSPVTVPRVFHDDAEPRASTSVRASPRPVWMPARLPSRLSRAAEVATSCASRPVRSVPAWVSCARCASSAAEKPPALVDRVAMALVSAGSEPVSASRRVPAEACAPCTALLSASAVAWTACTAPAVSVFRVARSASSCWSAWFCCSRAVSTCCSCAATAGSSPPWSSRACSCAMAAAFASATAVMSAIAVSMRVPAWPSVWVTWVIDTWACAEASASRVAPCT